MAAGGVIPQPRTYWEKIQSVCRHHDVMVVADEVITGFGRCGVPFGYARYGIEPNVMVVSKLLISSYQPLAAVLISDELYGPIARASDAHGVFRHGFTASGPPVATAVALENLAISSERRLVDRAAELGVVLQSALRRFAGHRVVGEVRGEGLIGAVQLVADRTTGRPFDLPGKAGAILFHKAHEHGLIIRAIGDTIAFCPPLITTEADIGEIAARFERALADTDAALAAG